MKRILKTKEFDATFNQTLKESVEKHQNLLKFCDDIEMFFCPYLPLILFSQVFYIIFMAYNATMVSSSTVLYVYLIDGLCQLLMLTGSSEIFTMKTTDIMNQLYEMPWYLLPAKYKQVILIVQIRLQRPVRISFGKISYVCLDTFINVSSINFWSKIFLI